MRVRCISAEVDGDVVIYQFGVERNGYLSSQEFSLSEDLDNNTTYELGRWYELELTLERGPLY